MWLKWFRWMDEFNLNRVIRKGYNKFENFEFVTSFTFLCLKYILVSLLKDNKKT